MGPGKSFAHLIYCSGTAKNLFNNGYEFYKAEEFCHVCSPSFPLGWAGLASLHAAHSPLSLISYVGRISCAAGTTATRRRREAAGEWVEMSCAGCSPALVRCLRDAQRRR